MERGGSNELTSFWEFQVDFQLMIFGFFSQAASMLYIVNTINWEKNEEVIVPRCCAYETVEFWLKVLTNHYWYAAAYLKSNQ